jgi:glycosyltransferase involved in cell wall biosynthesis
VFTNIPNPYNGYLYRSLRRLGWDVVTVYKGDPQSVGRAWQIELEPSDVITGSLADEGRVLRRCRAEGRDVILSGSYVGLIEVERRVLVAGTPSRVYFWGERLLPRGRVQRLFRRLYFSGLDGVLAIGSWARVGYQSAARSRPVHVLPYTTRGSNGVVRQPAPEPVIGYVGDLIERKGVDILLRGLAAMPAAGRPALEAVGDGAERETLKALARELHVDVAWRGRLSSDEIDAARARWWAQAVPSRYDGWGVVVAEAMASGVPVVASTNVGAALDMVRPGFNGALVDSDAGWRRALGRACDTGADADASRRQGEWAAVVADAFSADAAAQWLTRLLSDPPPASDARSFVDDAWRAVDSRRDVRGGTV